MTRLEASAYLDHLQRDSARFRAVLTDCDPGAPVPACPDWVADDLLWHLAQVQGFWATVVETRPAGPPETQPERPGDRAGLLAALDEHSARLATALRADPDEPAWHWSAEQTVGASIRRQAHEALVHRVDAEQTAGLEPGPLDPLLAADGVAELLEVMYGGEAPPWGRIDRGPAVVHLHLTDADVDLWAEPCTFTGTHPESGKVCDGPHVLRVDDPGRPAEATVSGPAGAVDAWLWKRHDGSGVERSGDPAVLAAFDAAVSPALD